jgi:hypothetical protein
LFVYDPVLVLLCFRQNISGSTFFNVWRKNAQNIQYGEKETQIHSGSKYDFQHGAPFKFDHRDFSLCYNATQFQLNPEFQAVSTLTEKGKEFSRKAGTGIALIEIKLLDPNDSSHEIYDISVGKVPEEGLNAFHLLDDHSFRRISEMQARSSNEQNRFRLSVRIYNTTLDVQAIYRWIGMFYS